MSVQDNALGPIVQHLAERVDTLNETLDRIDRRIHDTPCADLQRLRAELAAKERETEKAEDIRAKRRWSLFTAFLRFAAGLVTAYLVFRMGASHG